MLRPPVPLAAVLLALLAPVLAAAAEAGPDAPEPQAPAEPSTPEEAVPEASPPEEAAPEAPPTRAQGEAGAAAAQPGGAPAFTPPSFVPVAEETAPIPLDPEHRSFRAAPGRSGPTPAGPASPFSPEDSWLDVGHAFVEQRIFQPVIWFDRFFSDERELEAERSRSFLRFRNELRLRQDGAPVYGLSIRADLRLPGLGLLLERLRLVITGESEDTATVLFPNDPAATPLRTGRVGRADAELRYRLWDGFLAHVDLGGGVLLDLPPGVFGRLRYRLAVPVDGLFLTRYAASGFWRTDTGFGTLAEVELERPLGPASLARLGANGQITEKSLGVEWTSGVALLRSIGPRRAIQVGAEMTGATRSPIGVDRYRLYARLRRDVFRRWIFIELEPEVAWPWTPVEKRERAFGIAFRLEVQFQGTEPPEPPPDASAEPADPPALGAVAPAPWR